MQHTNNCENSLEKRNSPQKPGYVRWDGSYPHQIDDNIRCRYLVTSLSQTNWCRICRSKDLSATISTWKHYLPSVSLNFRRKGRHYPQKHQSAKHGCHRLLLQFCMACFFGSNCCPATVVEDLLVPPWTSWSTAPPHRSRHRLARCWHVARRGAAPRRPPQPPWRWNADRPRRGGGKRPHLGPRAAFRNETIQRDGTNVGGGPSFVGSLLIRFLFGWFDDSLWEVFWKALWCSYCIKQT